MESVTTRSMIIEAPTLGFKRGVDLGTSKNIVGILSEYKDAGRFFPISFLLDSWGSLFEVPNPFPYFRAGHPEAADLNAS